MSEDLEKEPDNNIGGAHSRAARNAQFLAAREKLTKARDEKKKLEAGRPAATPDEAHAKYLARLEDLKKEADQKKKILG